MKTPKIVEFYEHLISKPEVQETPDPGYTACLSIAIDLFGPLNEDDAKAYAQIIAGRISIYYKQPSIPKWIH